LEFKNISGAQNNTSLLSQHSYRNDVTMGYGKWGRGFRITNAVDFGVECYGEAEISLLY